MASLTRALAESSVSILWSSSDWLAEPFLTRASSRRKSTSASFSSALALAERGHRRLERLDLAPALLPRRLELEPVPPDAGDLRLNVGPGLLQRRLRRLQRRLALCHRDLERLAIEPDQEVALADEIVLVDEDRDHIVVDPGAHIRDVAGHEGVVVETVVIISSTAGMPKRTRRKNHADEEQSEDDEPDRVPFFRLFALFATILRLRIGRIAGLRQPGPPRVGQDLRVDRRRVLARRKPVPSAPSRPDFSQIPSRLLSLIGCRAPRTGDPIGRDRIEASDSGGCPAIAMPLCAISAGFSTRSYDVRGND